MNNYYEQIRKACIKVNPSILDLKMGCEVQINTKSEYYSSWKSNFEAWKNYVLKWYEPRFANIGSPDKYHSEFINVELGVDDLFLILWRPLHLEDILFAHFSKEQHSPPFVWTEFSRLLLEIWDYSKSVENQSEETLKFICDNIK